MSKDVSQFIVTIGFRAKPGKATELERKLRDRVPISRTQAGTLDYRLYRSRTDENVFFLFSRYATEKSFDIHLYQPYTLSLLAEYEDLLEGPPRVETYTTVLG
jgi:quinol monooxygenase YgiN